MNKKEHELFTLIGSFLITYLPKQKGCSYNTVKAYRDSLNLLLNFCCQSEEKSLIKLDSKIFQRSNVEKFLDYLVIERHCNYATRNHRLSCIKSFLKFAMHENLIYSCYYEQVLKITHHISNPPTVPYLKEEEIQVIFDVANKQTKIDQRNLVMLIVMYDTGARVQELVNLKISDCILDNQTPSLRLLGKGQKVRFVPLMKNTKKQVEKYLQVFHPDCQAESDAPLFFSIRYDTKMALSIDAVERFVKKYGIQAQLTCATIPDNLYPHIFRHSRAMHLYQAGMPLTLISQWLGHANVETTMIYAFADTKMKRDAIAKATNNNTPLALTSMQSIWNDDEILKRLYGLKV